MKYALLVLVILCCLAITMVIGKAIKWLAIFGVLILGGAWIYKRKIKPIFSSN